MDQTVPISDMVSSSWVLVGFVVGAAWGVWIGYGKGKNKDWG